MLLHVGQTVRAAFNLLPGAETLVVDSEFGADAPAERSDTGQVIDRENLDNLPSKSRDFTELAALAPGAASDANKGVRILGMRSRDNLTFIDGSLFTHGDGGMSFKPSSDALQEFDVKSGLYSAEYGTRPGAQIIAVTRSGSNAYHGNLFWFHRNDNFDARNFFEQRKAEFKRNQVGGTLGGPIYLPGIGKQTDRAWFFASYQLESRREVLPLTGVVPTESEKLGRFAVPIRDPLTRALFPDDTIPDNRINPVARQLLHFWPAPNTAGQFNYTSPNSRNDFDNPQVIARVDFVQSPRTRWSGRFVWDSSPYPGPHPFEVFSTSEPLETFGQSLSNTTTLWSALVNIASVHWMRRPYTAGPSFPKPEVPKSLGIEALMQSEIDRSGVPTIDLQGYTGIGDTHLLGPVNVGNWQVRDDLSLQKGNHALRFGVNYRRHYNFFALERRSELEFYQRYSGNAFADFLLGYPARTILGGTDMRGRFHQDSFYFYGTDEVRLSPRWNLSLGLRYELRLPWSDRRGFMANFDIPSGTLFPPLQDIPLAPWESGRFQTDYPLVSWNKGDGFLPRFGTAYRLTSRSVLRAGYGMYSNEADLNMVQELGRNPRPGDERPTFLAQLDQPTLTLSDPFPAGASSDAVPSHFGMETPLPLTITHSWGASVQQNILAGISVSYGYQGSHTTHRMETISINDAAPGTGDRQLRRLYPELQAVEFPMADADAWYQGMYVQVEKNLTSDGLYLLSSFSWSRDLDTGGGDQGSMRQRRYRSRNMPLHLNKGVSEMQVPRRLLLTGRYELPFGPGRAFVQDGIMARFLQGWSIQGISNFQDGPWFTVYLPGDTLDTGSEHSQWPDRISNPNLPEAERTPNRWFDTSAFILPESFRYGNAGRGTVEGPGMINLDFALHRAFDVHDTQKLEIRLEMFNAANHTNFTVENGSQTQQFGTPGFGAMGKALPARQLQVALKYSF